MPVREQFRDTNGAVMHIQTTGEGLILHQPGAKRLVLQVDDIKSLQGVLDNAKVDLLLNQHRRHR